MDELRSHITIYNDQTGQEHSMKISDLSAEVLTKIAIKFATLDEAL